LKNIIKISYMKLIRLICGVALAFEGIKCD